MAGLLDGRARGGRSRPAAAAARPPGPLRCAGPAAAARREARGVPGSAAARIGPGPAGRCARSAGSVGSRRAPAPLPHLKWKLVRRAGRGGSGAAPGVSSRDKDGRDRGGAGVAVPVGSVPRTGRPPPAPSRWGLPQRPMLGHAQRHVFSKPGSALRWASPRGDAAPGAEQLLLKVRVCPGVVRQGALRDTPGGERPPAGPAGATGKQVTLSRVELAQKQASTAGWAAVRPRKVTPSPLAPGSRCGRDPIHSSSSVVEGLPFPERQGSNAGPAPSRVPGCSPGRSPAPGPPKVTVFCLVPGQAPGRSLPAPDCQSLSEIMIEEKS